MSYNPNLVYNQPINQSNQSNQSQSSQADSQQTNSINNQPLPAFCIVFNLLAIAFIFIGLSLANFLYPDPVMLYTSGIPKITLYMPCIISTISSFITALIFWALSSMIRRLALLENYMKFVSSKFIDSKF
jgi:hypothetical protein